ncbi:phospholipase D family protein [Acidovorax sp. Root219]|uniref:phospholipase D family protein n=1 Tax=Acidovorax sp. Root219 TaxID=1736493 RepID=UPI0009EB450F|nr:phospholipase D family protein [Acidovorax sp. Root219]
MSYVSYIERLLRYACTTALIVLALPGCSTLPAEGPRTYSTAMIAESPATAMLEQVAEASMRDAEPGQSGFRMLLGPAALDLRLELMRKAERSIDMQYYHLHDDITGRLVMRELRDAAKRGIRVRLLLDDLYTDGLEPVLHGLECDRNVEVRLFNPFPTRGGVGKRIAGALFDFARLNRRMHNKMFVVDGALAIAGGRNLGDEYFLRSLKFNFFDFDVLIAGPVVSQMGSLFDEYWNSPQVRTLRSVQLPEQTQEVLRQNLDIRLNATKRPDLRLVSSVDRQGRSAPDTQLAAGRVEMVYGHAQAFADSPAKAWGDTEVARLRTGALLDNNRLLLRSEFQKAHSEIAIASPYLVPDTIALEGARVNIARGVKISLLTNSLAASDEQVVHTGYRRYRDRMLRSGLTIFELHPSLGQKILMPGEISGTPLRLHSKATIIDRERLFIGSANFDPRSEALNTEFGIFINSPALAVEAFDLLQLLQREASYQVALKGHSEDELQWIHTNSEQQTIVVDSEPGADPWTRLRLFIQSIVIPESLL